MAAVGRPPTAAESGEAGLVERARSGDAGAYAALIDMHAATAFRTAVLVTRSAADAEDAVQDALVKAHAALGRFRAGAPFRPWLLRIVVNEARNRRRSAGRREELALRVADEPGSAAHDAAASPEAALLAAEQRRHLLAAVESLRDGERLVVACRYFLDLSEEETAAVLGCRRGTVKSRLSRGLARLREEVERDG